MPSALRDDLRHAFRGVAAMPVVAAVVVGSLAIGIAVNTVVFSWVQALVLRPLPGVPGASSYPPGFDKRGALLVAKRVRQNYLQH